jgi:hypothetical protein
MSKTVTLRHMSSILSVKVEYFYDGQAVARDGLLTLPVNHEQHLKAAYFRGYQKTPEGKWLRGFEDLMEYVREVAAPKPAPVEAVPVTQTAESAEEVTDESNDDGGQSPTTDRVRSSKRKSRAKATK